MNFYILYLYLAVTCFGFSKLIFNFLEYKINCKCTHTFYYFIPYGVECNMNCKFTYKFCCFTSYGVECNMNCKFTHKFCCFISYGIECNMNCKFTHHKISIIEAIGYKCIFILSKAKTI